MSKKFKPLGVIHTNNSPAPENTSIPKRQNVISNVRMLEEKIKELNKEKEMLLQEIESLKDVISLKEKELEVFKEKLRNTSISEKMVDELATKFSKNITNLKDSLKEDFIKISRNIIKTFILSDIIPKEDIVIKILEDVFSNVSEIKGSVKVFLSPSDIDRAYSIIGPIKEKLSEHVDIEILPDESLSEGELRVDTPKLLVERKNNEILDEIFKEVIKNAL